ARYVLADRGAAVLDGTRVAADEGSAMELVRVNGPLRVGGLAEGLYPGDTWSGRSARYTVFDCRPGTLAVTLGSDTGLFKNDQVVVARVGGREVARASVPPAKPAVLNVPVTPRDGRCVVDFAVGRTAVPAEVTDGKNTDTRELGVHFNGFSFTPR